MADLVATVGGATANSYATVDDADDLAESRATTQAATWRDSSDDDAKARALMTATAAIDAIPSQSLDFVGDRATDTQALEWPRTGTDYADDVLPTRLVNATIELALTYLADASAASPAVNDKKSVDVGGVKVEWFDRASVAPSPLDVSEAAGLAALNAFPATVRQLLSTLVVVLGQTVSSGWGAAEARRVS